MTLPEALDAAILYGDEGGVEEVGGFIFERQVMVESEGNKMNAHYQTEYLWAPLVNEYKGTPTSHALFTPTLDEIGQHFIKHIMGGWKCYASFHTHPSFSCYPSGLDLRDLFKSAKIHYIYSLQNQEVGRYDWANSRTLNERIYKRIKPWQELNESL